MAIKINNTTIIDDSRNIVNAGVITATSFFGSGANLTGVGVGTTSNVNTTGIITASSFSGTNINLSGIITATSLNIPPSPTSFSPIDGATNVTKNTNISLTYAHPIQKGTGNITIRSGSASGTLLQTIGIASTSVTISGQTVIITPTNSLPYSTDVYVVVPAGAIQNTAFLNNSTSIDTYNFTIEPHNVIAYSPTNSSTAQSASTNITLSFTYVPVRGTGTITLRSGSAEGTIVESYDAASSDRISISGNDWILDPTSNLSPDITYYLVIPNTAIDGYPGLNIGGGTASYSFTTGLTLQSFTPTNSSTNQSISTNITFSFDSTPVRGTGTITLRSGSAEGTIVESYDAASSDRISISGNDWILDPTSNLSANTTYYLVIPSGAISGYNGTSSYSFTTAVAPTVSLSASPTSGTYNTSTTLTWSSSNATSVSSSNFGASSVSGSTSRNISSSSFTYSITVSGLGGSATASRTVTGSFPALGSCFGGGNLICSSGGIGWIASPLSTEVQRNWYARNNAVTCAQSVTGLGGWFIPTCGQLQNPLYICRSFWQYNACLFGYWSNTSNPFCYQNAFVICPASNYNQINSSNKTCNYGKARAFRCVTY